MCDSANPVPAPATNNWLERNWHPLCGAVYLSICLLDFAIMPIFYEATNYQLSAVKSVDLAMQFKDGAAQIAALNALHQQHAWQPITLGQNGLFHIAFGAILGVGVWTRGRQQGTDAMNNLTSQLQTMNNQSPQPAQPVTAPQGPIAVSVQTPAPTPSVTQPCQSNLTLVGMRKL